MTLDQIYRRMRGSESFEALAQRLSEGDQKLAVHGAGGALTAFAVACIQEETSGPVLVVCPTEERAEAIRDDLERLISTDEVGVFPAWEVSPYDRRSPHLDVTGLRLEALEQLHRGIDGVVVAPAEALMGHTVPPDMFSLCMQEVRVDQEVDLQELADHLVEIGYERVGTVEGVGQFSVRGGIVDAFSFGNAHPVRMEFFGDEVTSIRAFDLATQRSVETLKSVRLLSCREAVLPLTMADVYDENVEKAETALGVDLTVFRETLEREGLFDGLEHYLGVIYAEQTCLLDYVGDGCIVVVDDPEGTSDALEDMWERTEQAAERQKPKRGEAEPLPVPGVLRRPEEV
ncbi:MAG: hypothetical protein QGI83_01160, partial [Candidatus Latescibacteria bacterium]|nr:hypothetical protein [Candidatus Latescibacterota bacterium]